MNVDIVNEIKNQLRENDPALPEDKKTRMYKILNSSNPNFESYGLKISEIEKIIRDVHKNYPCSYEDAVRVFEKLISSDNHEENFSAVFFLNRFKKKFSEDTINLFYDEFFKYCDSWAICDSTMIRVIGPFLGKKGNEELALRTINRWSNSKDMWIRRASMVILLKLVMIRKDFDQDYVFSLVEKMTSYSEDYLQKGIGWLLKTCSKYKPDVIFQYLMKNKTSLSRLVLRYASEKLPEEMRTKILKK
jgi:3-methyladenine DNA glycosylase AlkD